MDVSCEQRPLKLRASCPGFFLDSCRRVCAESVVVHCHHRWPVVEVPKHQLEDVSAVLGTPRSDELDLRVRAQPFIRAPQLANGLSIIMITRGSLLFDLSPFIGAE